MAENGFALSKEEVLDVVQLYVEQNSLQSTWKGANDMPGTFYACSERGWMTSTVFHQYFLKFCQEVKERPLLLIFDGNLTHLDVDTALSAKNNQIEIIKLPADTTDVLQPLDTACFKTLKYTWDLNILKWYRSNQRILTKSEFVDMLCSIWSEGITSENVKSGFRARKKTVGLRKKKQEEAKKRDLWSDTDSEVLSEVKFPDDDSDKFELNCGRDELLREIEMEEQSDIEFEEQLGNYEETET
ncbi:hypothetical protein PR048_027822 [Dryococelus australis]|uniref:DDE-1 domain-containing protein n=1 Tax=Dryococelus australis TaxID=614101 RepID=A0ABQ9GHJ4_9NEOP|nr:hypothetical protein PR048_027822 [Dryococelus australis]